MEGKHVVRNQKGKHEGGSAKYSPDSPAIAALWLEPSLLINHTYKTHRHAQITHTTPDLSFLPQNSIC